MLLPFFFHFQFDHQLYWLTTKHNDGLETAVVVRQSFAYAEIIRTSKLTRAFYARVKIPAFGVSRSNETLPSSFKQTHWVDRACRRPPISEIRFVSVGYNRLQNTIFNLIGVASTLATLITKAEVSKN